MTTPATATRAFFSFVELTDAARHRDYNEWHQLDHRPENLALPGVLHGDRWVRTPADAAAGRAPESLLAGTHYVATYWFAEPAEASMREWRDLGELTLQQGRRPELGWTNRLLMGMFRPVRGYVAPRVRVSAAALPFRPHRGVHVTVTAVDEPRDDALFAWYDQQRLPGLLAQPGVAGAWTFRSEAVTALAGTERQPWPGQLRLTLAYLDGDCAVEAETGAGERLLFASHLHTIEPWRWDWFGV